MENQENNNSEELKKELESIRTEYTRAKRLLQNIQEFGDRFEQLKTSLEDENNGVDANTQWIRDRVKEIEASKESAQTFLAEISANLQKVKENVGSMQVAYAEFTEIKGKSRGVNGEIDSLVNSARSLQKDIERIKTESQQTLENVKNIFGEVQQKISDMQSAYQEFLTIKSKIDDENTGLQAIFNGVQDLDKKARTLHQEIQTYKAESKKLLDEISGNKKSSDELKIEIEKNLKQTQENTDEIRKVTDLIVDTGFANAFQKRAKKLFVGYVTWGVILGVGVFALGVLIYVLFIKGSDGQIPELKNIIYRLSLTSPLLFLIGFSMRQYGKERDLNEKYEFKAATAIVIRNHIKFLLETFDNNEEVITFAISTFRTIYKEPYKDDLRPLDRKAEKEVKKAQQTGAIDAGANLNEVVASIKELTSLIPDEETLKKVFDIFIKR